MYALQQTTAWKDRYKIRSGIEATNSELKRAHGIGRLKVRRLAKGMLCRGMQGNGMQHQEMGQGPLFPGEGSYTAVPELFISFSRYRGPMWRDTMFPENHLSLE